MTLASSRLVVAVLAMLMAGFLLARPADAAVITIGSPLDEASGLSLMSAAASTWFNPTRTAPGATAASPVDGVVLRWRKRGNFQGGPFRLRVVRPAGSGFVGQGSSAPVTPASDGIESFPTLLPIKAGDLIGVDSSGKNDAVGVGSAQIGTGLGIAVPPLSEGGAARTVPLNSDSYELQINADVQPAPQISTVGPQLSGSVKGGTEVIIIGTDLLRVTGVSFGTLPAPRYTVFSENQIVATVPPALAKGKVSIVVGTIAGSATYPQPFEYLGCRVPGLRGMKLKGAKKRLRAAECRPGKVWRQRGVTARAGRVVKQKPVAGTLLGPEARVSFKLG
jgi:hypothetical protein